MSGKNRVDDLIYLRMMHEFDVEGRTGEEVGRRFSRSRGAVLGLRKRINDEADEHPWACTKPENIDGGMPAKWWAA